MPELAVDPGDAGNDAVGLDGAKNGSRFGIDLMDPPPSVLPHPERPFRPREPRVTAAAGRRDRREHTACLRIDLLDAILGDLKQVLAVEPAALCVRWPLAQGPGPSLTTTHRRRGMMPLLISARALSERSKSTSCIVRASGASKP